MCFICDLRDSGNLTPAGSAQVCADLADALDAAHDPDTDMPLEERARILRVWHLWRIAVADAASVN